MLAGLTCIAAPGPAIAASQAGPAVGDSAGLVAGPSAPTSPSAPTYADLVNSIETAPLVLEVQVRKVAAVEPQRAPGVRAGRARVYLEARPVLALRGIMPAVETVSYLADVRLDARGKLSALVKRGMLLLARPVAGHPEMLQLVTPDAQLAWDATLEARARGVIAALQAPDAPSAITSVREASYAPGALVGEGETQIFLATADGSPAAISVLHHPLSPPSWNVSFSEVVDPSGQPPAPDTLAWYRLACFLPGELPASSNVSATPEDRAQAADDYQLVVTRLGPCRRTRD